MGGDALGQSLEVVVAEEFYLAQDGRSSLREIWLNDRHRLVVIQRLSGMSAFLRNGNSVDGFRQLNPQRFGDRRKDVYRLDVAIVDPSLLIGQGA
jgi:hypothetical protein